MSVSGREECQVLSLYWGYSIGGVGKYGVLLDKAAKKAGIKMCHVCIRGHGWQVDSQTLSELGATEIIINSRLDLSWIKMLGEHLREINPELVMTHGYNGHFIAQLMRKMGYFKGEIISSYHGLYHPTTTGRKWLAPIFNGFTEWHIRRIKNTVAVAEYSKRYLVKKGVPRNLVDVIHNGIEDVQCGTDVRNKLREEWDVEDDCVVIGVASRLDPVKGVEYLLTAFSRLIEKCPDVLLVLVGTGTVERELQAQARELGLDTQVRFTGFRSDVAECLSAFDVFVLPSLAEYHSIALLEAMRAGKAIVATDVGGNTESVRHGNEALVVQAADVDGLEAALDRVVSEDMLREQLGNAARARFLSEFTEDVMLKKTGAWLSRCLERAAQAWK